MRKKSLPVHVRAYRAFAAFSTFCVPRTLAGRDSSFAVRNTRYSDGEQRLAISELREKLCVPVTSAYTCFLN